MTTQSGASAEALPLPKGGGSTRGMGDGFTPDLNRGTGSYAIEIETPQGHRSQKPKLALTYNTANGDSAYGFGWNLPLARIQIDTDRGAADYDNPRFLYGGETLVDTGGGFFRQQVENSFSRIRRVDDPLDQGWEVTSKDGAVTLFGRTPASRISGDVDGVLRTYAWLIDSVRDTNGNEIQYSYRRDGNGLYLERVTFGPFEIRFGYEERHDPSVTRRSGFAVAQNLRCQTIEVLRPDAAQPLIRRYMLHYSDDPHAPSLLMEVTMVGFKRQRDGTVAESSAPPVIFSYAPFDPERRRFQRVAEGLLEPPGELGEPGRELVDLGGDGLPDVVHIGSGRPRIWRNIGNGRFAPPRTLPDFPHPLVMNATTALFDADGRGTADVVVLDRHMARYYPNNGDGSFARPRLLGGRRPLAFDFADLDSAFADVNGDGRVDLLRSTARGLVMWQNRGGDAGFDLPVVATSAAGVDVDRDRVPDVRLSDPYVYLRDMTGDGLPDIVHVRSRLVEYWPSLGGGRFDRRVVMDNAPALPAHYDPARLFLADVNGTGTSDILYVGDGQVLIWRNLNGMGFATPYEVSGTPRSIAQSIRVVDLLGTGQVGVLWTNVRVGGSRAGYRFLALSDIRPYLLTHAREGTGMETEIVYGSSSSHAQRDEARGLAWTTQLPMPVAVVDRIIRRDRVTGRDDLSEIAYHNGRWDAGTRRFRGFGRVTVRRRGDPDTQQRVEEHRFLVGAPEEPDIAADPNLDAERARRGQNYQTSYFTAGADSPLLRTETTTWRVVQIAQGDVAGDGLTPVLFPQVVETVVSNFEGDDHPRLMTTAYTYDSFGNVIREVRTGHAPNGDDDGQPVAALQVITEMEYATNPARYVVDRAARTVRRDSDGNILAEVRNYYDGPNLDGLPLGQVEAGLLRRQEEIVLVQAEATALYGANEPNWTTLGYHATTRVDGVDAWAINHARYEHTAQGMIAGRSDPFGNETSFTYDADGLLVVQVTNPAGHIQSAGYDPAWQLIESRTAADGGTTFYEYDGLGRLRTVVRSGDTEAFPTLRYTHDHDTLPNSLHIEKRRESGAAEIYEKTIYYDGLGRELQKRTRIDGDRARVSATIVQNERGEPVSKGQPLFRTGLDFEDPALLPATPTSRYFYDGIGRLVTATNEGGQTYRVSYTPWTATHEDVLDTDPGHPHANTPRMEHLDAFGRLTGVTRVGDGGTLHRANYRYDLLGRLVASTDLEGRPALRSVTHDGRGLKLHIDHAAAGERTVIYDARGRVVQYWDARGQIVSRTYDPSGRLLTEAVDGMVESSFQYDATSGRLRRVDDAAGKVTFSYDARGHVVGKTREIDGRSHDITYGYDAAGLNNRIVYPNGAAVSFTRWGDGHIRSVDGLVDELEYTATGRLTAVHHSNGVDEQLGYGVTGYLESISISDGGTTLYDAQLANDALGRLTRLNTMVDGEAEIETYSHNALGQLTDFTRQADASVTGYTYEYDADGNLLRGEEMDVDLFSYDFSAPGALTSRTLSGGAIAAVDFDLAGHLTGVDDMSLTYDARGRLTRVTKTDGTAVEMTYDYRGARVMKRVSGPDGNFTVSYVDDLYEEQAGIATAYVLAGGRLVGHLRGSGQRHLHVDHRGSPVLITRTNGTVDGQGWFGPYGHDALSADESLARQYTGAVFDSETGLLYLNHRYYSPALGRFLTPDPRFLGRPERELSVPEAHNLYAYANGDPVDYVDPTGQGFWSSLGKVLAAIVVVAAVIVAVAVAVSVLMAAAPLALLGAGVGAIIGGATGGWEGAALGAMMGATIGINLMLGGPLGIITFLGVFPGIREEGWYKSLAGWSSWLMPASWPGHIMGLGVFLGNGIAHVFGSDKQIESVKFDWKHGQIMTAGGEYGGSPFPWAGVGDAPAHNVGGFSFYSNDLWTSSGESWEGMQDTVEHETGHMLSNALFGFWQGVVNGIENFTTEDHNERFFEEIAESNVNEGDRDGYGREVPIWS